MFGGHRVGYYGCMGTYRYTAEVDVPADEVFAFLRDPRNLPRYFPEMTSAEPTGGEQVHVEADLHGQHVEAEAWLHVDEGSRELRWGAESSSDYHGELQVSETVTGSCEIAVVLHTETGGDQVQRGLEEAVAALAHTAAADSDVRASEQQGGW